MQSYDGPSGDFPLAYAHQRVLTLADDLDKVHRALIAKLEPARHLLLLGEAEHRRSG